MTPEQWEKVSEIFQSASELPVEKRKAFLDDRCKGDTVVRSEVESLLAAESEAGDFIQEPLVGSISPDETEAVLLAPSYMIGHYRIERSIGTGGMGEVYLATDTKLNRYVALKILPERCLSDKAFVRRFRNEALAAATLNHPHVATIYSVEEHRGRPFITMEYIDGKTLREVVPSYGLPIDKFVFWFDAIASALAHAHDKGIIHRDIKPGNIMVSDSGIAKVLDFGLAQMDGDLLHEASTLQELTAPGQVIGTPSYMSPEQAEGRDLDQRSDIFSLGIVMYEAISGERPFRGDSYGEVVRGIITTEPRPITEVRREIPPEIARMIAKCLSKEPNYRFSSMHEIRAVLKRNQLPSLEPGSMDSFVRRFYLEAATTSRSWIVFAAVLVFVLSISAWFYFSRIATPALDHSNVTFRKLSQSNNVVYAHVTPDGRSVVYNTIEENEQRAMWIRRVEDRTSLRLMPPQLVWYWGGMAISPDSNQIYFITAERSGRFGSVYRISSLGGEPRKLVDGINDIGAVSPDGNRLLLIRYDEGSKLISVNATDGSGEVAIHSSPEASLLRDPQYSIDGRSIFICKVDNVGTAETWSLVEIPADGGAERTILSSRRPKINEIAVLPDGIGLLVNQADPVSNLNQLFHVNIADGTETRVTNDLNSYFGVSISADGRFIATAQRVQTNDIWTGSTTEPESMAKFTREPIAYLRTAWTPDNRLVFDGLENNRPQIFVARSSNGEAERLTNGDTNDAEPIVSPNGEHVYFMSDRTGERKIWRINIDGGNPLLIGPEEGTGLNPVLSPDGKEVLFNINLNNQRLLGRYSIDRGEMTQSEHFGENYWAISPDGTRVAYAFYDDQAVRSKVAIRRLDNREPDTVIDISPINVFMWSGDGKGIFYRERERGDEHFSTIWKIDVESKSTQPFLNTKPDSVQHLSFSRDGTQFAVVRGRLLTDAVLLTRTNR